MCRSLIEIEDNCVPYPQNMMSRNQDKEQEVIRLLPAVGQATRIASLPGSKESYPIGYWFVDEGRSDIRFRPEDAFTRLLARLTAPKVDVVLGLFPTPQAHKGGMVDFDAEGRVRLVLEKPPQTNLCCVLGLAVWTPIFTHFMHEYLAAIEAERLQSDTGNNLLQQQELPMGDVFQAAIDNGLQVEAEVFADGTYLDIGTPEDIVRAVRNFAAGNLEIS